MTEDLIFETTYPLGGTAPVGLPEAPEPRVFKFTFQGQYEVWSPPPTPPSTGSPQFLTLADSRGFYWGWTCRGGIAIWYYPPGGFGPGPCWYPPPPGALTNIAMIYRVQGEGILQGSAADGFMLIGSPLQVSVHRLETPIRLTRLDPPSSPPVGQTSVLAEVIPAPQLVGGVRMPMRVSSWTWTPTQVGVSAETSLTGPEASCPTGFTEFWIFCSFTARESGTLTVRASVNGGPEQEASITVNVVDCITGDTLIDRNPVVRRALRDALDGSNADASPADRVERLGGVVCTNGQCTAFLFPFEGNATPCSHLPPSLFTPPSAFPPGTVVIIHVHPFFPERELLPTVCGRQQGASAAARPSQNQDLSHVLNLKKPLVLVDKKNVYVAYPEEFAGNFPQEALTAALANAVWSKPRGGSCDPLQY